MLIYLSIGFCIMFLIEVSNHALENYLEKVNHFNMIERIIGILIWPFIVFLFIKFLLK